MKFSIRSEWPFWTLMALMFLASAIAWPLVPERFPMHFNLHGQVDHWGTRAQAGVPLLLLPAISIVIYVLMLLTPKIDPGRANYDRFGPAYWVVRFAILAFFTALHVVILLTTLNYRLDIGRISLILMGVMFLALGSVLGKIRPNWFVGLRTPWTLSSKLAWTHGQRAGGWLFVILGPVVIAAAFLPAPWNIFIAVGSLPLGTIGLVVYTYILWRRDPDRVPPSGTTPVDD